MCRFFFFKSSETNGGLSKPTATITPKTQSQQQKQNMKPWSIAAHRPLAASILKVSLIAVYYAIVLNHHNTAIYFLMEN